MREINAALTIGYRDFTKLLRDRPRIIVSLIFPIIFIGAFGGGLQSSLGASAGFNLMTFVFTGIFAQTLFQSTAMGIVSLIQDRENDFSQEIFISPISRYTIIFGKILGESMVSFVQVIGVLAFGLLLGVSISFPQFIVLITTGIISCLFGGAFGVLVMANMTNMRAAAQVFPFVIFPQIFLSGVFTPIGEASIVLKSIALLMPLTYPVDLTRALFYAGSPDYNKVVLLPAWASFTIISVSFVIMLVVGTYLFVRNEKNR